MVEVLRRYSNRPDLLEQLRKMAVILSGDGHGGATDAVVKPVMVHARRWHRLRDRFSPEDLQTMINLYKSGTNARPVAEKFQVSERIIERLLHQHEIRRKRAT